MNKVYAVNPPEDCDICNNGLRKFTSFYDAKTLAGSWAWMCKVCYDKHGIGLGTGKGQKYNSITMVKVEG